jgi:hypothetical protein
LAFSPNQSPGVGGKKPRSGPRGVGVDAERGGSEHDAAVMWVVIGLVLAALLVLSALMDRGTRHRGARVIASGDIWREVREANRDSRVIDSGPLPPRDKDVYGWTSWTRRNRGGR